MKFIMQQKLRSPLTKNSCCILLIQESRTIFEFVSIKWKIGLENKTNTFFGGFKSPTLKLEKRKREIIDQG